MKTKVNGQAPGHRAGSGRGARSGQLSRRAWVQGMGLGFVAGCLAREGDDGDGAAGSDADSGGAGASGGGTTSSGSAAQWAIGGTAAMLLADTYGDPFSDGAGDACPLTCTLTQGPCWAPRAPMRQDVSEGQSGIPMRLALQVVQADGCTPVEGAEIEIWHCNVDGVYSAEDVEGGSFCTGGDESALAGYFFRGRTITDAEGKAAFDGCFPGWYSGRAVHIHLLVRPANSAGEATTDNAIAMTQLFFPEALTSEIFDTVEGYADKGQPDTSFDSDNVLRSVDDVTPYVVEYDRMEDGAMLAWKSIVISESEQCGSVDGGGGPPGGPPA